jgi:hypothetical protein
MACVPLMSEMPSLDASTMGWMPARRRASAPGRRAPFELGFAFADEHQRDVGQRREIAAGADAALRRNDGRDAAIQQIAEAFRNERADAGKSLGEHVGADEHHAADFVASERRADSAGVRADHVALELLELLGRDANVGQQSDAGVDGVNRGVARGKLFDHRARAEHGGEEHNSRCRTLYSSATRAKMKIVFCSTSSKISPQRFRFIPTTALRTKELHFATRGVCL